MGRFIFIFVFALPLVLGCKKMSYRKTPGGMLYQVFPGKDTQMVRPGNVIKISLTQKINDSVYFTTQDKMPIYFPVMPTSQTYDLGELWLKLKKGDSVVATQMMDTFIVRNPASVPPQFKKGDRIISQVKILDIFPSDSLAQADNKKIQDDRLQQEVSLISNYLAEKKINTQKTSLGSFVEIKNPGTGPLIDTGNYVTVNYTGTSWSGVVFDSNVDTAFHHVQPYSFVIGDGSMIRGFDEGMLYLRKGAAARIYIPSMLAYGANPGSPKIKPLEHLIFDITVLDVQSKAPEQQAPLIPPGH